MLGINALVNLTGKDDIEQVVEDFQLRPILWKYTIDEVLEDDSLDHLLEGELFEILLKTRLWFKEYKEKKAIFKIGDLL